MNGCGDQHGAACSARADLPDSELLDYAIFIPCISVAAALGFSLRIIGPLFLLIPLLCVVYAISARTMPPRLLSAYVALCLLWAALSHFRAFPSSWQSYYLDEAVVRQLVPVVSFFAIAWASKAYFRRRLPSGTCFANELLILFLCLVVAPLVMIQQGMSYQGDDAESSVLAAYGALINNITIGMFFVLGRLFFARGWSRAAAIAYVALVAVTTHFLQFKIITVALLATLLRTPARLVAAAVMAGLTLSYAAGMQRIPELVASNPNSGLRLLFIQDTVSSLKDTYGLGIGYGTESVRWTYRVPGSKDFTFMPNPREITQERMLELLSRGVHNSFAQAALRTGVLGALLLVCAFLAAFPPCGLPDDMRAHASVLFIMIFMACFVNPGLESPVQVIGIGFVYGYLLALRARAKGRNLRESAASLMQRPSLAPV